VNYGDVNIFLNYVGVQMLSNYDDMTYDTLYKPPVTTIIPYTPYDNYSPDQFAFNSWSYSFDWNAFPANKSRYITNIVGTSKNIFINLSYI
jgi:hypothetical protein